MLNQNKRITNVAQPTSMDFNRGLILPFLPLKKKTNSGYLTLQIRETYSSRPQEGHGLAGHTRKANILSSKKSTVLTGEQGEFSSEKTQKALNRFFLRGLKLYVVNIMEDGQSQTRKLASNTSSFVLKVKTSNTVLDITLHGTHGITAEDSISQEKFYNPGEILAKYKNEELKFDWCYNIQRIIDHTMSMTGYPNGHHLYKYYQAGIIAPLWALKTVSLLELGLLEKYELTLKQHQTVENIKSRDKLNESFVSFNEYDNPIFDIFFKLTVKRICYYVWYGLNIKFNVDNVKSPDTMVSVDQISSVSKHPKGLVADYNIHGNYPKLLNKLYYKIEMKIKIKLLNTLPMPPPLAEGLSKTELVTATLVLCLSFVEHHDPKIKHTTYEMLVTTVFLEDSKSDAFLAQAYDAAKNLPNIKSSNLTKGKDIPIPTDHWVSSCIRILKSETSKSSDIDRSLYPQDAAFVEEIKSSGKCEQFLNIDNGLLDSKTLTERLEEQLRNLPDNQSE